MNFSSFEMDEGRPEVRPFLLMRDKLLPELRRQRSTLDAMYAKVMGRPEMDPVILAGVTVLQMMETLADRGCAAAAAYDVRWWLALGGPVSFHPTTLVYFRQRLAENGKARIALDVCLKSMRDAGCLRKCRAVRIDSTHLLGRIADMSRLECVRETLSLALGFLSAFEGAEAWEPWFARYAERSPDDLRNASAERLASSMEQAGVDMRDVLAKAEVLGDEVAEAGPVALLRRVFGEQFRDYKRRTPSAPHNIGGVRLQPPRAGSVVEHQEVHGQDRMERIQGPGLRNCRRR